MYLAFALALMALGAGTAIWGYQRGIQYPLNRISYDKWYWAGWMIAVLSAPFISLSMVHHLSAFGYFASLVWGGVMSFILGQLILKLRDA